ncbi:MAG: transglycosylase SLT domain-containing protein [Cyanobium sp.]
MTRLATLLTVSCLGTGATLLAGRALLERRPALTPLTPVAELERQRRWAADPGRRREASLLLLSLQKTPDPTAARRLLWGQAWGNDELAALVLKQQAQAVGSMEGEEAAQPLWRSLQRRFPGNPASADSLYVLGRSQPALRQQLLARFPAHPAALAAALEAGPEPEAHRLGAVHLARWGPRWPGADERLRQVCGKDATKLSPGQRARIATGLAELGDGEAAMVCLSGGGNQVNAALTAEDRLTLGRTLLKGPAERRGQGLALLAAIPLRWPKSPAAADAVRLLSQQDGPEAAAALQQLPPPWRDSPPVLAHRALAAAAPEAAPAAPATAAAPAAPTAPAPTAVDPLELLRRWPGDPASWDLQWELSRLRLLQGDWPGALQLLEAIQPDRLPPPLAARQRFWLGYTQRQLGRDEAATTTWRELLLHHPGGYYGWRAALQLGEADPGLPASRAGGGDPGPAEQAAQKARTWQPLASGDAELDRLWRLGQRTEAWEVWRHQRGSRAPEKSPELLLEGRLRQGVGDDWTGLGQLERASLILPPERCDLMPQMERNLHPRRFLEAFGPAAERQQLPLALLLGVARQESRFTPAVRSAAGAVGLLQLMPETAAELAGASVSDSDLKDPARNADLGARYLRGLMKQWQNDPILVVASYNAGPGAVQGWTGDPRLRSAPELWIEAIPYPETRIYVKKVLGNVWSYQQERRPAC